MKQAPWNRLWVQLSLTFGALVVIAALVFVLTIIVFRPQPPEQPPPEEPPVTQVIPQSEDAQATVTSPDGAVPPGPEPPPEFRDRAQSFIAKTFLTLSVTGAILGIVAGIWTGRRIAKPLERLSETARAIGARDLTVRAPQEGTYEMISLAKSFNQMAEDLQEEERLCQRQAEAHQLPLNLDTVDAREMIRDAGEIFEPIAIEKEGTLTTSVPSTPVMLEVDPARITQVVHNLLANALRHTPSGGAIAVELTDAVSDNPGGGRTVRVQVIDTGTGIEPEHIGQVFNRFYRTDKARARDDGGVGLGLAISRALVEEHGGAITAASPGLGQGCTFTVTLFGATGAPRKTATA